MKNLAETDTVFLEQLVYTWAEHTLTGTGNGVVLRSSAWPTGNNTAADAALADFVEYLPAKLQHRLGSGRTPPLGADFWQHPEYGNVVAVHRYLGVDSAGRGGRSIVHVFLDRERRLNARSALELCRSQLVAGEWDLKAEPVRDGDGILFVPGQQAKSGNFRNEELLLPSLAGVLEYIIQGRQIVFTHDHDIDALGLLEACLSILPRALASRLTFSTYRGIPQRSKCAVSFASTFFSEVRPKGDPQKTYLHLDAAGPEDAQTSREDQPRATGFSAAALDLATELLRLREAGGPECPADINSVHALDQWLRHYTLALRPVDSLELAECAALLALPAQTSWLHRDQIIERTAILTAAATPTWSSQPSFLAVMSATEKDVFGRTLHSVAVAELESSPGRALTAKHQADTLGYPAQRLADLAVPILDRLTPNGPEPEPALKHFIAEIAPFVPLPQRLIWASRPIFQDLLLSDWKPTAQAVAIRTWTEPQWANDHTPTAKAVALRYPKFCAEYLATALASNAASSGVIDSVLALDHASRDEAFTEVIRNVAAQPGIQKFQLRRLAACELLPPDTLADILAITEPPPPAAPAEPAMLPSAPHAAFTPGWPTPTPAPTQHLFRQSQWDSPARSQHWVAADRDLTFAQRAAPAFGPQAQSPDAQQPATARRRKSVRLVALVLSTIAGYLVADTEWQLFVWLPAVLIVLVSLVVMILPVKLATRASARRREKAEAPKKLGTRTRRRMRLFRSKHAEREQPLKTGSRFSWKARKPPA